MKLLPLFLLMTASAAAQQGPIDPAWVYVTRLKWHWAPKGIDSRWTFATIAILYPEGQYVEVSTTLMGYHDKSRPLNFSAGDGNLVRTGTWARTDDNMIRIHSRDVWWDPETVKYQPEQPHPKPFTFETCALEGQSPTHLAKVIHCQRLSLSPLHVALDFTELQQDAAIGLAAAPLRQPGPATPR
jgi:hypothetical protein